MARNFNGTTDNISADAAAGYSQQVAYTVAFFINAAAPGTSVSQCPYGEGRSTTNNPFLIIENGNVSPFNTMFVTTRGDAGGGSVLNQRTTAVLWDSTWHHFIYTQDGSGNWAFYVEGALDKSGSFATSATTINRLTLGEFRGGSTQKPFAGKLAEVGVWHREISAGEAASLGNGLPASFLAPTHYWPLWGIDSPEPDIGGGTHTAGTLTGTTAATGGRISPSLLVLP